MKYLLIVAFVYCFQVLKCQETDKSIILQDYQRISNIELSRILDSISLVNLHPNFFENNLFTNIDTNNIDSLNNKMAEQRRMNRLFGNYSDFQRKFLALDLKSDLPEIHFPKAIQYNSQYGDFNYAGTVGFSFSGPVSALYNAFSKEEQSRRKYYALKEYEPSQRKINAKYNYQNVKLWTNLDDENLTKFVLFCHFENDYLLNVSEYDLIDMVLIKLVEFKAINDSCNYAN